MFVFCALFCVHPHGNCLSREQALPNVTILAGSAESLPVAATSVDVIVSAQAAHWFEGDSTLAEFHRVLKPNGQACVYLFFVFCFLFQSALFL